MKKTLKLVIIFGVILFAGFAGGLAGYFLIQENKTYYIYDLRIVEPVEVAPQYVYLNDEYEYTQFKNKKVYLTSADDNKLEIGVYISTSIGTRDVELVSSNTDVADFVFEDGKCFVYYKKAGKTTITASHEKVKDSFDLYVYNQPAEDLKVFDNEYYGEYSEVFPNKVVAYADDLVYEYDIVANSAFATDDNDLINADLLRIDESSINKDVFDSVVIDAKNKKLKIQCKSSITELLMAQQKIETDESIVIQSYFYSSQGDIKLSKSYIINVHVIADTPEFLQVIMATTPDFSNSYVFMDTTNYEDATEEQIYANIEDFLSYQKAETYLAQNTEKSVYNTFFTSKTTEIYLKFRKVYTNGDIVYLNPINAADSENPHPYSFSQGAEYLTLSQNKEYYILKLNKDDFAGNPITITLKLDDYINFDSDFVFEYKEYTAENVDYFYSFDAVTQSFVYTYWDLRAMYDNEICNAEGQIINFGGIVIDFSKYPDPPVEIPEDDEGVGE